MGKFRFFVISFFLHTGVALALLCIRPFVAPLAPLSIEIRSGGSQKALTIKKKHVAASASATTPAPMVTSGTSNAGANDLSGEEMAGAKLGIHVEYPKLSRVLGEEGRVLIGIEFDKLNVLSSSGHARLDQAALRAVQSELASGLLAEQLKQKNLRISFVFRLTKSNQ